MNPFYPHGDIPVPFSQGYTATCVEAVWQGLKVFEDEDVDVKMFLNDTMKDIKRTVRKHGWVLGHGRGVYGTEILGYVEAKPLSHAYLVKAYAEELYPFDDIKLPEK